MKNKEKNSNSAAENEPISGGTKAFLLVFAFVALVILPWGIGKWFSNSALPFLPGSSETSARVERKYTTLKSTSSQNTRTAYHIAYSYSVHEQRYEGMTVVPQDFYAKFNEGQEFSLRFTIYHPSWSCPSEAPPEIKDWIFFGLAGLVIIALWVIAILALRYSISPS